MFTVSSPDLKLAIRSALLSAASDAYIPALCAVQFIVSGDTLRLSATDRYSLVTASLPVTDNDNDGASLISRTDLGTLIKALPTKGVVFVTLAGNSATFRIGALALAFEGVSAEFPDVARLWPTADAIGAPITAQALGNVTLKVLGSIAVDRWIIGQASGGSGKPIVAVGNALKGSVSYAVLIMPVRVADGIKGAQGEYEATIGRVSASV